MNDNRRYDYSIPQNEKRDEYAIVASLVAEGERVVDLGCGDGALLDLVARRKPAEIAGVEIAETGVEKCRAKGYDVLLGRIDERLPFEDDRFDVALCNVTVQMTTYPEALLSEMKRVARRHILTFPNFAYYKNRLEALFFGRMPRTMLGGYRWHSTGHIHQLSLKDFEALVEEVGGLRVTRRLPLPTKSRVVNALAKALPNLFAFNVLYELERIDE